MKRTVCLVLWLQVSLGAAQERPNILFLFADDQAFDTIAAAGQAEIDTPNLDRLVRRGILFTHAYNQGGWHGAVCVASRTMLMTGRFLWHARDAERKLASDWVPERRLWPQIMQQHGYRTYFSGKWHVKAPAERVFDVVRHVRGGMPKTVQSAYDRPQSPKDTRWSPWDTSLGGHWEGGRHWSEVVADDGRDFLRMAAGDSRPFFMYLAFSAPHDPRQSPKRFVDRYPPEVIQVPPNFLPEYPYDIGSNRIRDERLAPFPRTPYAVRVHRQEYYAIISHMDEQIGRILDALEESGLSKRTWIVFSADHGLACGHHGLMGKQNMYDPSVRVPLIVCGPGARPGGRCGKRVCLQSIMPTVLDIAGIERPDHVEFPSLMDQVRDPVPDVSGTAYGAWMDMQRMITSGQDKLILYPAIRRRRFFDLSQDPFERNDLAGSPQTLGRQRRLFARLQVLQRQTGDDLDLAGAFPELAGSSSDSGTAAP